MISVANCSISLTRKESAKADSFFAQDHGFSARKSLYYKKQGGYYEKKKRSYRKEKTPSKTAVGLMGGWWSSSYRLDLAFIPLGHQYSAKKAEST